MNELYPSFFDTFTKVSAKIHAGQKVSDILNCIVEDLSRILDARGCIYWLLNHDTKQITAKVSHGFDYRSLSRVNYEQLIRIFPPKEELTCILDARNDERIPDLERLGKRLVGSVTAMGFNICPPFSGILAIYFFSQGKTLDTKARRLVSALGEQGALALQKTIGFDEKLLKMVGQIIESLALAIEAKDPVTHGHSQQVARLSKITAKMMGLSETDIQTVEQAAILHDIGKIGIEDTVIEKLGRLNSRELKEIHQHPVLGARILSPLTFFDTVAPLIRCHHELYDGTGYPSGLKGDDIPIGARIISVCDAFETMISGRPHMDRLSMGEALDMLQKGAGTKFDPKVIRALVTALDENPRIFNNKESTRSSLMHLKKNLLKIADHNRIKKKLTGKFPFSF